MNPFHAAWLDEGYFSGEEEFFDIAGNQTMITVDHICFFSACLISAESLIFHRASTALSRRNYCIENEEKVSINNQSRWDRAARCSNFLLRSRGPYFFLATLSPAGSFFACTKVI